MWNKGVEGGETFTLTTSDAGSVTGDTGDDLFIALEDALTQYVVDGGAGEDTLKATLSASDDFDVSNVETLSFRALADVTIDMDDFEGETSVILRGNTTGVDIILDNFDADVAVTSELTDNLTLEVVLDDATGSADSVALVLDDASSTGDVTIDDVETIEITSSGSDNVLTLAADAVATITLTGSADLDIDAVVATVTTFDASAFTGALTADVSLSIAAEGVDFTGGSGDDVITADAIGAEDVLDGGAGEDELLTDTVLTSTTDAGISNFEILSYVMTADVTADGSATGDIDDIKFYVDDTTNIAVTDIAASGLTVTVSSRDLDLADGTDDVVGTIDLTAAEDSTADSVTLELEYDDTGTTTPVSGDDFATGVITADDAETLNLVTSTAAASSISDTITVASLSATDATSVVITGDTDLTIGATAFDVAAEAEIDASDFTGVLTLTIDADELAEVTGGITGGSGSSDVLTITSLGTDVDATATAVADFETVVIESGVTTAAYEVSLADFDATTYRLDVTAYADANGQITISGLETGATLEIIGNTAAAADIVNIEGAGSSSSLTLNVADETLDFTGILNVTRVGTLTIDTDSIDTDGDGDVTQNALNTIADITTTSVDTLNIDGEGSLTFNTANALDDDITAVDLSDFGGTFIADLGEGGVTVTLSADMIVGVTVTTDATETNTLITAANSLSLGAGADTIVFADSMDNDVVIFDFEEGLGGDILDLTALGITSFSDITFVDVDNVANGGAAADDTVVLTFDGFDGELVLVGVLTADLDSSNFIFA